MCLGLKCQISRNKTSSNHKMKIILLFKLFTLVGVLFFSPKLSGQKKYYVSNKSNGKHHYGTIHHALSAVEKQIKRSGYPKQGIEVIIKDGNYKIDKPISITKYLSGTKKKSFGYQS